MVTRCVKCCKKTIYLSNFTKNLAGSPFDGRDLRRWRQVPPAVERPAAPQRESGQDDEADRELRGARSRLTTTLSGGATGTGCALRAP